MVLPESLPSPDLSWRFETEEDSLPDFRVSAEPDLGSGVFRAALPVGIEGGFTAVSVLFRGAELGLTSLQVVLRDEDNGLLVAARLGGELGFAPLRGVTRNENGLLVAASLGAELGLA